MEVLFEPDFDNWTLDMTCPQCLRVLRVDAEDVRGFEGNFYRDLYIECPCRTHIVLTGHYRQEDFPIPAQVMNRIHLNLRRREEARLATLPPPPTEEI